jgi:hypothetical protein
MDSLLPCGVADLYLKRVIVEDEEEIKMLPQLSNSEVEEAMLAERFEA